MATIISGGFRLGYFDFYNTDSFPFFAKLACVALLIGWGPGFAAFLSWKIFGRQNRTSSLFGNWKAGAIFMAMTPAVIFGLFGYPNSFGMNPHLAGFILGGLIFVYALGEEIGWRGYMQDALSPKPLVIRAMMIGVLWWAWHLFFTQSTDIVYLFKTILIVLPTALLLSWIMSESRSWLSIAAFHSIGNIAFMATAIDMPSQQRFIISGTAFVVLLICHHFWKKRSMS
jgi:membrane protease YdiL (CAAX protease family)